MLDAGNVVDLSNAITVQLIQPPLIVTMWVVSLAYTSWCSGSFVLGGGRATVRRSTASTATRSTAVASTCASTVSRSWPSVQSACRGRSWPVSATGHTELTVTFVCCRGKFYDSTATENTQLRCHK